MDIRKQMPRFILLRSLLVFAFVGVISFAFAPTLLTCVLLVCIGFAYAMYYIMMLSLSMELIPEGKAGFFDGMVGLGAAIGAFLGPFLAIQLELSSNVPNCSCNFLSCLPNAKIIPIKNKLK